MFVLAACAAAPPPVAPSPTVRQQVASAEDAEKARQHDVARTRYEAAIASAHEPVDIAFARREYAETLISWGELEPAIAQLEAAAAAHPDAGTFHDLGILRHHEGDDAGATLALERAKELAPNDPRPRIALAALRWSRGDTAGATTEYRALLQLDLPDRLRTKVQWALDQLAKPQTVRNTPGQ